MCRHGHTSAKGEERRTAERNIREFLQRLEFNLSIYLPIVAVESGYEKKSGIRRNLERLSNRLHSALADLDCLDKLSLALLGREHVNGINEFRRQLEAMTVSADRALTAANGLPNKHKKLWRHLVADTVAECMRDYLRVNPDGNKNGLYDELLGLVFEGIGHSLAAESVHRYVCGALARLKA